MQQPEDALQLLNAGAALVQLDSGLVYSGPGLPKRINEAVAYFSSQQAAVDRQEKSNPLKVIAQGVMNSRLQQGWLWMAFLGTALILGSILVCLVAATLVVLPYDEAFVGISRAQIAAINTRLLPFMTHDRVTLAGTMLSLGILYVQLAIHGVRKGMRWAWFVIVVSCLVGFASFFLFHGPLYRHPGKLDLTCTMIGAGC